MYGVRRILKECEGIARETRCSFLQDSGKARVVSEREGTLCEQKECGRRMWERMVGEDGE